MNLLSNSFRLGRRKTLLYLVMVASTLLSRAQELEGSGKGGGALFSPAVYLEVSTPLTDRVAVNTYGFYLCNVKAAIGLVEAPISASKHLSFTSSYMFINVPAAGLSLLTGEAKSASYQEHQFRQAATLSTSWRNFNLSDRNMYVRRFIATGDINRYRNRIYVSYPVSAGSYRCALFIFDEVYHDFASGPWLRRNWIVGGVDMPVNRYMTFQLSYVRQDDSYLRCVNFFGVAFIVRTQRLLGRK
jgi:hypothetical protein